MKKISQKIFVLILVLILARFTEKLAGNTLTNGGNVNEKSEGGITNFETPGSAASHAPIFIDGDDPTKNWDTYGAVTGSGTHTDPYVIRDLEIDCGGTGSGIYIMNSIAYAVIENCTIINAGLYWADSGIRIEYCRNLKISDCLVKDNELFGIYIFSSFNNTLTENTAANNLYGISLDSSFNNTLTGNTAANTFYDGIFLWSSYKNALTENTAVNNSDDGIYLHESSNNTLTGNTAANNSKYGIYLYDSSSNTLTGNTAANNSDCGIELSWNSLENGIFFNVIHDNPIGIEIDGTSSANIFDNWIWKNLNYAIYENGGEAKVNYPYNYYIPFCPLYDTDHDGLSDGQEIALHTSPTNIDTDNDNFLDGYEVLYGTDPLDPNDYPAIPIEWINTLNNLIEGNTELISTLIDWSNGNASLLNNLIVSVEDNATLLQEVAGWLNQNATVIQNMLTMLDGNATLLLQTIDYLHENVTLLEITYALATQNTDYLEALNGHLESNTTEIRQLLDQLGISIGDTDYDGLDDLDEVLFNTSLTCWDTDNDNLGDAFEVKIGTDPLDDDTDNDGWYDGVEVAAATNPLSADDYPNLRNTLTDNFGNTGLIAGGIGGGLALGALIIMLILKKRKK